MRQRTTPHTPALSSTAYDVGGRTITLLPGLQPEARYVLKQLETLAPAPTGDDIPADYVKASDLWASLLVASTWDDPAIEIETKTPDDLTKLTGEDILGLARAAYIEIFSRATTRLMNPAKLLDAGCDTLGLPNSKALGN